MNDFRYAFRSLRRSPGLAAVAVASLALGIGANTAIFSVANAIILRSLPVQKPSELVLLRYVSKKGNVFDSFAYSDYLALRDNPSVLAGLSAVASAHMNIASAETTERAIGLLVSPDFFSLLGVHARIGRLIQPGDDRTCVLGYGLWQRRFGSAQDVIGRKLDVERHPYTIIGVAPESFEGTDQGARAQVYLPLDVAAEIIARPVNDKLQPPFLEWDDWLKLVGRRKSAVSIERAQAVLDARFAHLPLANRNNTFEMSARHGAPGERARLQVVDGRQGFDNLRFQYERPLVFLMFLVGLLLLIACANVASLLTARAAGQRKQIAIRLALGASRWDMLRQQLAESSVLSATGAALGLLLSIWMTDLLVNLTPAGTAGEIAIRPDWTVGAFLIGLTCLTTLLFGTLPVIEAGRTNMGAALKSESAGGGKRRGSFGPALVAVQVAISVILLAGAGVLLRSLSNLRSIHLGFEPRHVLVASLELSDDRYPEARAHAFFENLLDRAETIPGVQAASLALVSPLSGSLWLYSVDVPGYPARPKEIPMVYINAVGPGYFSTIGSQLVEGREFTRRDRDGTPYVAIVNEQMARKFWPGRDPIGQRFKSGIFKEPMEVVGVVRDSIYRELREQKKETLYVASLQAGMKSATLQLRGSGDSPAIFAELRARVREIDRDVPLYAMQTLDAQIAGSLSPERMLATVSTLLGGLAIVLAMVGLYSMLANSVAERAREIGIRIALGAAQNQVVRMIVRDTLRMVAVGVVIGVPLSLLASRWIGSFLYGLKAQDPLTYIGLLALIVGAGCVASVVPSRRASRVDPMVVLRDH